jgi:transglutaminase-like putative cysteine protease
MRPARPLSKIALALLILLAAGTAGCGGCAGGVKPPADPTRAFEPLGEPRLERDLGLYSSGVRVGTLTHALEKGRLGGPLAGEAILLVETTEVTIGYQGRQFTVRLHQRVVVRERDLSLLASYGETSFASEPWIVSWERAGEKVFLRREWTGGTLREDSLPIGAAQMTLEALPMLLGRLGLRAGESRVLDLFSLFLRKPVAVTVEMQGESSGNRTFRIKMWGVDETVWIDEKGTLVKENIPMGIEARLPSPGEAEGALQLENLLKQAAIPAVNVPDHLGDMTQAELVLEGVPQLPVETPWQKVTAVRRGAELHLTRAVPPEGGGARSVFPVSNEAVLNLDSPYLQQIARKITAGVERPWDQAVAISRWVYGNLGKTMRECVSAIDVLRAGEGECQSHALLSSALCQSVGIPTRFVSGIVFMPQRGTWMFHAWIEVHVGEWIPVDPTLGESPAGVDHIALVFGSYLDQFRMAPFIFGERNWRVLFVTPETGPGRYRDRLRD